MRYGNQLVTMAVVAQKPRLDGIGDVVGLMQLFANDYGRRFGQGSQSPEAGIRATTIRVASYVQGDTVEFDTAPPDGSATAAAPVGSRLCHFAGVTGAVDTPVFDESALDPGRSVPGPAIVTTPTTTSLSNPAGGSRPARTAPSGSWPTRANRRTGDE
jgi:N-methylhydantoinase A